MKCEKCGHENPKQALFCEQCGQNLQEQKSDEENTATTEQSSQVNEEANKRTVIGIVFVVAVIALITILLLMQVAKKPKINLNNYLIITENGYEGSGSISIEIDKDSLYEDYGDKITWTDSGNTYAFYYGSPVAYILDGVKVHVEGEENTGLSNGDSVSYSWEVAQNQIESVVNCRIRFSSGTYQMSQLEETATFDPFKDVKVTATGVAPRGEATLSYTGEYPIGDFLFIDKSTDLSNGDVVTVTLALDDEDSFVREYGVVPESYSFDYTITGMDAYITSAAQIKEEDKAAYKAQADDVVRAYCAELGSDYVVDSSAYLGEYFLAAKDGDVDEQNIYGMVYKIISHRDYEEGSDSYTDYYYIEFTNVIADEEGNCEKHLSDYTSSSKSGYYGYSNRTYENLSELKRERVESEAADYNTEWNVVE